MEQEDQLTSMEAILFHLKRDGIKLVLLLILHRMFMMHQAMILNLPFINIAEVDILLPIL